MNKIDELMNKINNNPSKMQKFIAEQESKKTIQDLIDELNVYNHKLSEMNKSKQMVVEPWTLDKWISNLENNIKNIEYRISAKRNEKIDNILS